MLALDDLASIPEHIRDTLDAHRHIVAQVQYFEHLLNTPPLKAAAASLDAIISTGHVRAYHCTKELKAGVLASSGLRTLALDEHIAEFLTYVSRAAPNLESQFRTALDRWRLRPDTKYREGKVWFCLTRDLVSDGTEDFFTYFGGEALYRALPRGDRCLAFLASLGRPVVVEVLVPARDLHVFLQFPYARPLITRYAQTINPTFYREDVEGYLIRSVEAHEVVAVHERDTFLELKKSGGSGRDR